MRPGMPMLGVLLLEGGAVTATQIEEALEEQSVTRERLGEILLRRGWIGESALADGLALQYGYGRFDPSRDAVDPRALDFVPVDFARAQLLLPVRIQNGSLTVALVDPLNIVAVDRMRRIATREQKKLETLVATRGDIEKAIDLHYRMAEGKRSVDRLIETVSSSFSSGPTIEEEEEEKGDARRRAEDQAVIQLVEQILEQALSDRATDIHVEPQRQGLVIRYRVDGMLFDAIDRGREIYTGTISRIKILSNLDIAERRAAQDGRFTYRANGREVDVRVSIIPTIHGEKAVLRLLDKTGFRFSLRDLGYSEAHYKAMLRALHHPYGMILLSGPTGSGKSTTLYAGLLEIRNQTTNITTVEDPVEYQIDRINQVQVNERKKVTFGTALRSFLRQDPDVIMVGEVRDRDTAEIAVRAALTGHLVLTTIHANDAPSTATRLVSMGVESFLAASALTIVAAQRLVRRTCKHCLEEYKPDEEILLALGLNGEGPHAASAWLKGKGCAICKGRGYMGRVAIVEMMPITPALRRLVSENRSADEIRAQAVAEGMMSLRENGIQKARDGVTTLDEVLRVTLSDE
ncbi:MAG: GspE/PulE family protein [Candidatus Eisenbacteria bacterium]